MARTDRDEHAAAVAELRELAVGAPTCQPRKRRCCSALVRGSVRRGRHSQPIELERQLVLLVNHLPDVPTSIEELFRAGRTGRFRGAKTIPLLDGDVAYLPFSGSRTPR